MTTSTTRRSTTFRWLAAFGLALALLPALASDASAQYLQGGSYGRSYRGYHYAPRTYSRGYNYAPRAYATPAYGHVPRAYGFGNGFYKSGVPYRNVYRAPYVGPGYRMGFGGYPY